MGAVEDLAKLKNHHTCYSLSGASKGQAIRAASSVIPDRSFDVRCWIKGSGQGHRGEGDVNMTSVGHHRLVDVQRSAGLSVS